MRISVVFALPDQQQIVELEVDAGCTAAQAVKLAIEQGLDLTELDGSVDAAPLGVFGERVKANDVLQDADRVEIYRALQQDPMELRRQRAASEPGRLSVRRK